MSIELAFRPEDRTCAPKALRQAAELRTAHYITSHNVLHSLMLYAPQCHVACSAAPCSPSHNFMWHVVWPYMACCVAPRGTLSAGKEKGEEDQVFLAFCVPRAGIEPAQVSLSVFETDASTNSAIGAFANAKVGFFCHSAKHFRQKSVFAMTETAESAQLAW